MHFTVILLYGLLTVRFFIYSKLLLEEGGYCGIKNSNTGLSLRFQVARYMKLFVLTGNLAARKSSVGCFLRLYVLYFFVSSQSSGGSCL